MSVIDDSISRALGFIPNDPWAARVDSYLASKGYQERSIRAILAFISERGTSECCDELSMSDEDRRAVESMLPSAPDSEWDREFHVFWELGPVDWISL